MKNKRQSSIKGISNNQNQSARINKNNSINQSNPIKKRSHKRARSSSKSKSQNINIKYLDTYQSSNITSLITQVQPNKLPNASLTEKISTQNRSISPKSPPCSNYFLPKQTSFKKTLVLDLDETLVHSGFIPFDCPSDLILKIELDNELHDIHVLVRPYVKEFLEKMSTKYELVIFTASLSKYANPLLNIIDQNGYCPLRLFREHCKLINTSFVKDLKRLGRDLKDIIIVDNSPIAYALNQDNGFPISSWFNDKNDRELLQIIPILEFLSYVPDVREYIKKIVKDNKIQFDLVPGIIAAYNNELKKNLMPLSMRNNFSGYFTNKSKEMLKSHSNKNNPINNKGVVENLKRKLKITKKFLNISGPDFYMQKNKRTNIMSKNNMNVNNIAKDINSVFNRLTSLPSSFEKIDRMNTMKCISSSKKIVYLISNRRRNNLSGSTIKSFLKGMDLFKIKHKKNTLSMSQRINKKNVLYNI